MKMQVCSQFHTDPTINPVTGRQISPGGPAYRDLVRRCGPPPTGETPQLMVNQEALDRCVTYEIGRADEDRHFAAHFGPVRLYGIFDGHGGAKTNTSPSNSVTANYLRDNFVTKFYSKIRHLNIYDQNQIKHVINETFLELDREIHDRGDAGDTGSTAGIALITPTRLYLINLGDSSSVIFDNEGRVIMATKDNKPEDSEERQRIESLGGSVNYYAGAYRVNNTLAVARAFGDFGLKRSNRSGGYDPEGWVSVIPDIYMMDLPTNMRSLYLLMASDGLWDGFSPEEAARFLIDRPMTGPNLCRELVDVARTRTTDDVTAILIDI